MIIRTPIAKELVAEMAERFPQKCPILGTPVERIWFDAGQAAVVDFLRSQMAAQEEQRRKNQGDP